MMTNPTVQSINVSPVAQTIGKTNIFWRAAIALVGVWMAWGVMKL